MHFEILVEGQVELTALSILMVKIAGEYGPRIVGGFTNTEALVEFPIIRRQSQI